MSLACFFIVTYMTDVQLFSSTVRCFVRYLELETWIIQSCFEIATSRCGKLVVLERHGRAIVS